MPDGLDDPCETTLGGKVISLAQDKCALLACLKLAGVNEGFNAGCDGGRSSIVAWMVDLQNEDPVSELFISSATICAP